MIYDTVGVGWVKDLEEATTAITDTVTGDIGKTLNDYIGGFDTVVTKWAGTETVQSTLNMFGSAMVAQLFDKTITEEVVMVEPLPTCTG